MSLKPLLKALQGFPADKTSFLPYFGKLTLQDLGFYVEDVHAMKYYEDNHYPVARHAFMLENALNQVKLVAGSAAKGEAGFFPAEWKNKRTDRLGCSTLCDDAHVTLCWFVVPPGGVLPLHDHPTMSVWQRILFGKMRVTAVDWTAPDEESLPTDEASVSAFASQRAARGGEGIVVFSDVVEAEGDAAGGSVSPHSPRITHFDPVRGGGVLHELENVDSDRPALFVDIIAPPYLHPPSGIPCTYYSMRKAGTPPILDSDREARSGITVPVVKGDRVTLSPRPNYYGPEMNAFAHLSDD